MAVRPLPTHARFAVRNVPSRCEPSAGLERTRRSRERRWCVSTFTSRIRCTEATFTPVDGGTQVTESWEFLPAGMAMFEERFGADAQAQVANRAEAARTGIPVTLAALKRTAEGQ